MKKPGEVSGVTVFLNADHTHSLTKAVEAMKAGFDSVVADFSALSFAENVSRTKEAVEALKAINPFVLVEGEIGNIGTGSEIHDTVGNEFRNLTTAEEARQFVAATGIDVLAPAVGNMHGMLKSMVQGKEKKRLNIESSRRPPEYFSRCTAGQEPMMPTSATRSRRGSTSFTSIPNFGSRGDDP